MIERQSEFPKEVSADGIYRQIQANTARVAELKATLETIRSQENQMRTKALDRERLLFRQCRKAAPL